MNKLEKLEQRKEEILRRIEITEEDKKNIIRLISDLLKQYNSRELTREEYDEKLRKALKNKTVEQWIEYYDDYLAVYKKHLNFCEQEIKKEKTEGLKSRVEPVLKTSVIIALIVVFISVLVILRPVLINNLKNIQERISSIDLSKIGEKEKVEEIIPEKEISEIEEIVPEVIEEPVVPVSLEDKEVRITEEQLTQYQAVLGKPVRWKKQFTTDSITGFAVELPKDSEVIKIKFNKEDITDLVSVDKKSFLWFFNKRVEVGINKKTITRDVISHTETGKQEYEIIYETPFPEIQIQTSAGIEQKQVETKTSIDKLLKDLGEEVNLSEIEDKEIIIKEVRQRILKKRLQQKKDTGEEFIIQKQTKKFNKIKDIKITGPNDVHYENILSFAEIPEILKVGEESKLKLYQTKQNGKKLEKEISITAYDTNENGLLDYIEWITPYLSDWEGYIVIEISKAEHLDENKNFLKDIYEQVKEQDDVWSETIDDNEYVRVSFIENLTNENDITIYPKVVSGEPKIEVYEIGGNDIVAEFEDIINDSYNKVYLTSLIGEQDVFDLRIVDGSVEFDHIIDPTPFGNCDPDSASCGSDCGGPFYNPATTSWTFVEGIRCRAQKVGQDIWYSVYNSLSGNSAEYFYWVTDWWFYDCWGYDEYGSPVTTSNMNDACICDSLDPGTYCLGDYDTYFDFTHVFFAGGGIAITDCVGLQNMQNNLAADYYLTQDIDCSDTNPADPDNAGSIWDNGGFGFNPIGCASLNCGDRPTDNWFLGTLDGKGFTITGLYINRPAEWDVGLFGATNLGSEIKDVSVLDVNIIGDYGVGALAGLSFSDISNSHSMGIVSGNDAIGLLVGLNALGSTISNSHSEGVVSGNENIGGLVGKNGGGISNSYSTGDVSGTTQVGGLIGYNYPGQIINSYSTGDVSGTTRVGGLVGRNREGTISNSYSTGSVGGVSDVGGLVGFNDGGSCIDSFWDTQISGKTTSACGTGKTTAEMKDLATFTDTTTVGLTTAWDFVGTPYDDTGTVDIWDINPGINDGYPFFAVFAGCWDAVADPHPICTCNDLQNMNTQLSWAYELQNDINCFTTFGWNEDPGNPGTYFGFNPIGCGPSNCGGRTAGQYFTGTFDGQGFEISGLYINRSAESFVGLFGALSGDILNTGILDADVSGYGYVGGLLGVDSGTITNSYSTGSVSGTGFIGGLVGKNEPGTITNSYSTASVSGGGYVGGLTGGIAEGAISNSYSAGSVSGTSNVGGFVGYYAGGTCSNSFWDTTTSGQTSSACGTGKTTADMILQSTFDPPWDFTTPIWQIEDGVTYPCLAWQGVGNCFAPDITPPVITLVSIGGDAVAPYSISDNTPLVAVTTNENADCRASLFDETYDDMADDITCSGGGGTSHSCTWTSVIVDSVSQGIYVACKDTAANKNTVADNLDAAAEIDTAAPTQSNWNPAKGSTLTSTSQIITFDTIGDIGDCRASLFDETYDDMANDIDCTGDGSTSHSCSVSGMSQGAEIVYIACKDDTDVSPNKDDVDTNEHVDYNVDITPPDINFTWPTPPHGNVTENNFIPINVTADDIDKGDNNISVFIDFNNSLVGWWRMDETYSCQGRTICIYDNSTYGNDGDGYGSNLHQGEGYLGKGFEFDGGGDYVEVLAGGGSDFDVDDKNFALEAWFKTTSYGTIISAYGKWYNNVWNDYYKLAVLDTGNVQFNFSSYIEDPVSTVTITSSSVNYADDAWHHVVGVRDGERTGKFYVDGILAGEDTDNTGTTSGVEIESSLFIGRYPDGTDEFIGTIDDVMIFNRALSPEEIAALYANQSSRILYQEFTDLTVGNYTFKAYAQDAAGNVNSTEEREVEVLDIFPPDINFTWPTPGDGWIIDDDNFMINVSADDIGKGDNNISVFIDFNNSLVGWWRMDEYSDFDLDGALETGDKIYDNSTYRNDGTVTGVLFPVAGYLGRGVEFDGVGDWVRTTENVLISGNSPRTISLWMKPHNKDGPQTMFVYGEHGCLKYFNLQYDDDVRGVNEGIYLYTWEGSCAGGHSQFGVTGITRNEWNHFVYTYNGSVEWMYINGIERATKIVNTALGVLDTTLSTATIGNSNQQDLDEWGDTSFDGTIDDVMIFNRALSDEEIQGLYANSSEKYLFQNFTDLAVGNYTFKAYAQDAAGNVNSTEEREVEVDLFPQIWFTEPPTPADGWTITENNFEINVSIIEQDLGEVSFNWNKVNYTIYNDSLVLMMNFNDYTRMNDTSLYENHGICSTNCPTLTSIGGGKYNEAYDFDGNDYISVDSVVDDLGQRNFTVMLWVKTSSLSEGFFTAFNTNDGAGNKLELGMQGGKMDLRENGWKTNTGYIINNDVWHYIGYVFKDTGQVVLYADGDIIDDTYTSINLIESTDLFSIGQEYDVGLVPSDFFNGLIDEVRIWNQSFSADVIKQHYYSNLYKYDVDKWALYVNQSGLVNGDYTYQAHAIDERGNFNSTEERIISVAAEAPPEICDIQPPTVNPTGDVGEYNSIGGTGSPTTSLEVFRVIVYDPNGIENLPDTEAITASGYVYHNQNTPYDYTDDVHTKRAFTGADCSYIDNVDSSTYCGKPSGQARRYKCNVNMHYYDDPVPYTWDVYITSFQDLSANDITATFSEAGVFSLTEVNGFQLEQIPVDFGTVPHSIGPGEGVSSQTPIIIVGTANTDFNPARGIAYEFDFTGRDLTRDCSPSTCTETISANNFYAHLDDTSPSTCDAATNKITFQDQTPVAFSGLVLHHGDQLLDTDTSPTDPDNDAQKTVYLCMKSIDAGLPGGDYSTAETVSQSGGQPWQINYFILSLIKFLNSLEISIFVVGIVRKKKKKKERKDILDVFDDKLREKYVDFDSLLDLDESLKEKYNLGVKELLEIAEKKRAEEVEEEIEVPIIIFKQKIGPAEILCKYLKENLRLRFSEIAKLLNRDERTIWINYRNAKEKIKEEIEVEKKVLISVKIFTDRRLSILESVVRYLKEKGFKNNEIAEILNKDQRNIWTLYSRAKKKLVS